jgi:succinate-acetate transporter protein
MVYLEKTGILNFGADAKTAVGVFLLAWTIFTVYMWIATFRLNVGLLATFSFLMVTFVLLVLTEFKVISGPIAGYFGLATAFSAWYCSAAGIINPIFGRTVLPVGDLTDKPAVQSSRKTA